ncbi:MAG: type II toxin-antitoxin system YafQ family toxin [Oscillospiraceae bacterium]|nr:type II toxin-antitoxin system YafQ family toxin [Oscillospiraceae bacterium]
MMTIKYTTRRAASFKKDYKRVKRQGKDMALLESVITMLCQGDPLPPKYLDHALRGGEYEGCRECHIQPDWLLIYRINKGELELILLYTDSHSNLF